MYFPHWGIVKRLIGKKLWWGMSAEKGQERESKDGLDFGVEGDVGGRNPVDREFLAGGLRELKETADVIVLVVTGEEAFRFRVRQTEGRERNGLTKIASVRAVLTDEIAQGHDGSATGC